MEHRDAGKFVKEIFNRPNSYDLSTSPYCHNVSMIRKTPQPKTILEKKQNMDDIKPKICNPYTGIKKMHIRYSVSGNLERRAAKNWRAISKS